MSDDEKLNTDQLRLVVKEAVAEALRDNSAASDNKLRIEREEYRKEMDAHAKPHLSWISKPLILANQ